MSNKQQINNIVKKRSCFKPVCEKCKKNIKPNELFQFDDCKTNHFYHNDCPKKYGKNNKPFGCNKCFGEKKKGKNNKQTNNNDPLNDLIEQNKRLLNSFTMPQQRLQYFCIQTTTTELYWSAN